MIMGRSSTVAHIYITKQSGYFVQFSLVLSKHQLISSLVHTCRKNRGFSPFGVRE